MGREDAKFSTGLVCTNVDVTFNGFYDNNAEAVSIRQKAINTVKI